MIKLSWLRAVVLSSLVVSLVIVGILPVTHTSAAVSYPTPRLITSQPPEITMSRPAYLQPTAVPGLGTQIIRISDAATFGSGQRYYRHFYAKSQPWNSDGSRIILSHNSVEHYFLDGRTYAYQFTRTNVPHAPRWSTTNPDILFGINGSNLVTYHVSSNSMTTIQSFSGEGFSQLSIGKDEGILSNDSRYAPVVGVLGSNHVVIVYDVINDVEVGRRTITGDIDWASLSPSGNYVVVNTREPSYKVYDKQMNRN
jgi:hypothetical protein